jgi:small multidrug resistance pump
MLFGAIIAEVIATTSALKQAKGFTRLRPSGIVASCYSLSLYVSRRRWRPFRSASSTASGRGRAWPSSRSWGAATSSRCWTRPAVIGIALIVSGVLVLQFFSNTQLQPTEGPAHSLPRNTMAPSAT